MKKILWQEIIKNCFSTTGIALVVLSVVACLYDGRFLCLETVFQVLAVSVILQAALTLLKNFESRFFLVEIAVDMCALIVILAVAGVLFHWYESIPLFVLILIGVVVYLTGSLLGLYHLKREVQQINDLLSRREQNSMTK